jgi:cytoskeletal protein RodZ
LVITRIYGKIKGKKPKRFLKIILIILCIFLVISVVWVAFSLIGRIDVDAVIPESANVRISVPNTLHLLDGLLSHETLNEMSAVPALAQMAPILKALNESPFLRNRFLRPALRGRLGFALLP